jgi:predicted helicase
MAAACPAFRRVFFLSCAFDSMSNMTTQHTLGKQLEEATAHYLSVVWGADVVDWYTHAKQNGLNGQDIGIDLVAYKNGEAYAVQCKNWERSVGINDLLNFLHKAKKEGFKKVIVVADKISTRVEEEIKDFDLDVIFVKAADVKQYANEHGEPTIVKQKLSPLPHQKRAIEAVLKGFEKYDRGKLIMPPGTGKTYISIKIAESLVGDSGWVLFLAPSIALLDQTIREYHLKSAYQINAYAVVSDNKVGRVNGRKKTEIDDDDENNIIDTTNWHKLSLLSYSATTTAHDLIKNLRFEPNKLNIIFSTYQSLDVLIEVHELGLTEFELIICDEAHRTAGVRRKGAEESVFKKVHYNEHIKAKKRLYMTATPKIVEVKDSDEADEIAALYNMNDPELFGPTLFEYTFVQATNDGVILPYTLLLLFVDKRKKKIIQKEFKEYLEQQGALNVDYTTKIKAIEDFILGNAVDERDRLIRVKPRCGIIFTNRVKRAKEISEQYEQIINASSNISIDYIEGLMSAYDKARLIKWLGEGKEDDVRILANAKVLTEGIDVPALSFITFFDPKSSVVDVVQAVGRAVRKAPGKKRGYVILPILVNDDSEETKDKIDKSTFKVIWQVISALQSMDETLVAKMRALFIDPKKEKAEGAFEPLAEDKTEEVEESRENEIKLGILGGQSLELQEIRNFIIPKIVKIFRLAHEFIADWTSEATKLAKEVKSLLEDEIQNPQSFVKAKVEELREKLKAMYGYEEFTIENKKLIAIITQYIIAKPILDALFFDKKSEVEKVLDSLFDEFKHFVENNSERLQYFYRKATNKAKAIVNNDERQEFIRLLFTNFFNNVFKDVAKESGIAYTPIEVVNFAVFMTNELAKKHLGKTLGDDNVHIVDPFAGTGSFIASVIDMISPEEARAKVEREEIRAADIELLPYLILLKNIQDTLERKMDDPPLFDDALWTDSLYFLSEEKAGLLDVNPLKEHAKKHKQKPIHIVVTNPPWRGLREDIEDESIIKMPKSIAERIKETYIKYAKDFGIKNMSKYIDLYIQTLRILTDKVKEGIVTMVVNNSFLTSRTGISIRASLRKEYDYIYIYDLKGNIKNVMLGLGHREVEGENVFGSQTRLGVCVIFLVKNSKAKNKTAQIYYAEIEDGLKAKEKLRKLKNIVENTNECINWQPIIPNEQQDWLNQCELKFHTYPELRKTIFNFFNNGVTTGKDYILYDFSVEGLFKKVREYFNVEDLHKYIKVAFNRPFVPMWICYYKNILKTTCNIPIIDIEVPIITTLYGNYGTDLFITRYMCDKFLHGQQTMLYPLRVENKENGIFVSDNSSVNNKTTIPNINTSFLQKVHKALNTPDLTDEDLFYYIAGVIATPRYSEQYGNNLISSHHRVPIFDRESFQRISAVGRKLGELQMLYQDYMVGMVLKVWKDENLRNLPEYPLQITGDADMDKVIEYIRYDSRDKSFIINGVVKIGGFPEGALEHRIGTLPVLKTVANRLQPRRDEKTGITLDPKLTIGEMYDIMKKLTYYCLEADKIKNELNTLYDAATIVELDSPRR